MPTLTETDFWIMAAGALCALSCALLGNFLLLRKMSMMGDAISHAVLPGIAIAFLVTHDRTSLPMFVGAAIAGVLTALLTQWIHNFGQVEQGSSMGVVFTILFAVGLILIVRGADKVHLDADCVLYGLLEYTPLDRVNVFGWAVPRAAATLGVVFAVNLLFVLLLYKELKLSSFDPTLATTLGINATVMHYLLMTMVAITTVAAFESVGSILVIAMLIVPAAAANLLTDRLPTMIAASLVIGLLSAVLGHLGAISIPTWFGYGDTSTAGMMGVAAGLIFFVVMIASPRHGMAVKLWHRAMLGLRIIEEDALGVIYRLEELGRRTDEPGMPRLVRDAVHVNPLVSWLAMRRLTNTRRLERVNGGYLLTDLGRQIARDVVRTHRLWETYLSHALGMPADHLHLSASRLEHLRDRAVQEQLRAETGQPAIDPHGRSVPPRDSAS